MPEITVPTYDHRLKLRPGTCGTITFRFPKEGAASAIAIDLVRTDPVSQTIELALDDLWGSYEMMHRKGGPKGDDWKPIRPGPDGRVHVVLNLKAGERFYLLSEGRHSHSLRLEKADWRGNSVALTFRETA